MSSKADKFKDLLSSFVHSRNEVKTKTPNSEDRRSQQPRDKKAFYQRLHSFNLKWFAKPTWLSPPICARYGWKNTDVDILQCVTCMAYLSGRMPSSFEPNIYAECCKKLKESLKTAHHPFCPWSNNPSPEIYLSVPVPEVKEITEVLVQLISLGQRLPRFSEECLAQLGTAPVSVLRLQHSLGLSDHCDLDVFSSAVVLALCGWQTHSKSQMSALLQCSFCNREVGLWNYLQMNYDTESESDEEDLNPLKKTATSDIGMKMETPSADEIMEPSQTAKLDRNTNVSDTSDSNDHCDIAVTSSRCYESQSDIFDEQSYIVENCVDEMIDKVVVSETTATSENDGENLTKNSESLEDMAERDHREIKNSKLVLLKSRVKQELPVHSSTPLRQKDESIGDQERKTIIFETQSKKGFKIAEIAASLKSKVEKGSEDSRTVKTEESKIKMEIECEQEIQDMILPHRTECKEDLEQITQVSDQCGSSHALDLSDSCEVQSNDACSAENTKREDFDDLKSDFKAEKEFSMDLSESSEAQESNKYGKESSSVDLKESCISSDQSETKLPVNLNESCEIFRSDTYSQSDVEQPNDSIVEVIDTSSDEEEFEGLEQGDMGGDEVGISPHGLGVVGPAGDAHPNFFQNGYFSGEDGEERESVEEEDSNEVEDFEDSSDSLGDETIIDDEDDSFEDNSEEEMSSDGELVSPINFRRTEFPKDVVRQFNSGSSSEFIESESGEIVGFQSLFEEGAKFEGQYGEVNEEGNGFSQVENSQEQQREESDDSDIMILSSESEDEEPQPNVRYGKFVQEPQNLQNNTENVSEIPNEKRVEQSANTYLGESSQTHDNFEMITGSYSSDLTEIPTDKQDNVTLEESVTDNLHLELSPDETQGDDECIGGVQNYGEVNTEYGAENMQFELDNVKSNVEGTSVEEYQIDFQQSGFASEAITMHLELEAKGIEPDSVYSDEKVKSEHTNIANINNYQMSMATASTVSSFEVGANSGETSVISEPNACRDTDSTTENASDSKICGDGISGKSDDVAIEGSDVISESFSFGQPLEGQSEESGSELSETLCQGFTEDGNSVECTTTSISQEQSIEHSDSSVATLDHQGDGNTTSETMDDLNSSESQSRKRKKKRVKAVFDPLSEHRAWCVWVTCVSETDASGKTLTGASGGVGPAWKVMKNTFLPELSPVKEDAVNTLKMSPPVEGLRRIRKLLSGWASPQVKVKLTP